MKFSAQEEYGLRCLLQIAQRETEGGSPTIPEISRAEGLSQANVGKILRLLREGGYVVAARGQAGGYSLSRPAAEIPVSQVMAHLGGRLYDGDFCDKHKGAMPSCRRSVDCSLRSLWTRIQSAVDGVLHEMSLADLVPERTVIRLDRDTSSLNLVR
jgi:Rrf2 family protein